MQVPQYLKLDWKRRDVLVICFLLCCAIGYLSWQFGLAQLANQKAPDSAEQYKLYYPYVAAFFSLIVPFLINNYMDAEVKQETKIARAKAKQELDAARNEIIKSETPDGILAKQELEFVAIWVIRTDENEPFSIDSLINLNALMPAVQEEIRKPNAQDILKQISEAERANDEAVEALLSKDDNEQEVAEIVARSATLAAFGISQTEMRNHSKAKKFCKDLYKCLRAWLVCSIRKSRYSVSRFAEVQSSWL